MMLGQSPAHEVTAKQIRRLKKKRPRPSGYSPAKLVRRADQGSIWPPYYPQSDGKLERLRGTIKKECLRPNCPTDYEEAFRQISGCVKHYNEVCSHRAIGYITPANRLPGLSEEIHADHLQSRVDVRDYERFVGG